MFRTMWKEDGQKMQRWEKGQAIFHKKEYGSQKTGEKRQRETSERAHIYGSGYEEEFETENAYGRLRYAEGMFDGKQGKHGFILEAKEAPGTPGHTEREKHFKPGASYKIGRKEDHYLYAAGMPFRSQSFFYDSSEWGRSRDFLECMKHMLREQKHRTVQDTFGFLEQDSERLQKELLLRKQEQEREWSLEEFEEFHRQMNRLNSRIQQKEARERQMCGELQQMIDREKRKERRAERLYEEDRQRGFLRTVSGPEIPEWAENLGEGTDTKEEETEEGTDAKEEETGFLLF